MGCSSFSEVTDACWAFCLPCAIEAQISAYNKILSIFKIKTRKFSSSLMFSSDPTIRSCSLLENNINIKKNLDLYSKIREENDRLVPLLKAKLDELIIKSISSAPVMIGKATHIKKIYFIIVQNAIK